MSTHRRQELVHFSLQYPEWKKEYVALDGLSDAVRDDPTSDIGIRLEVLARKMHAVEEASRSADEYLEKWIFRHVAYGEHVTKFEAEGAPFSRDMFYSRLRKYYYILDKLKE